METTKLIYTGGGDEVCAALTAEGLSPVLEAGRELEVSAEMAERLLASSQHFKLAPADTPTPKRRQKAAAEEAPETGEATTDDEEQHDA